MSLNDRASSWTGEAYRHIPVTAKDVLDFRWAAASNENRWNAAGEPTLYLAGDIGIAVAEWGRHYDERRNPTVKAGAVERSVYRLELALERIVDLRNKEVWDDLKLDNPPYCFLDKSLARLIAQRYRKTTLVQGLVVPSVAALDDLERWCLVLFLEKMQPDPKAFFTATHHERSLRLE